jgi:hypothetical protein
MDYSPYGCNTAADCYECSLSRDPCHDDADCNTDPPNQNNRCIDEQIACITDDVCEPEPTCGGDCLKNTCTAATACVHETCVNESCGKSAYGDEPATCQNRKCADTSMYLDDYCGEGTELLYRK